ncbi:MAG: hypothetical protein J4N91_01545, partial [Chloroflexi bacterium]|nr:hypothetical protein [Chloroflexota bacterium]
MDYDFLMIAVIGRTYEMLGTFLEPNFGERTEELRAKLISGVTGNVMKRSTPKRRPRKAICEGFLAVQAWYPARCVSSWGRMSLASCSGER